MSEKFEFTLDDGDGEDEGLIEVPPGVIETVLIKTCPEYRRKFILGQFTAYDVPLKEMQEKLEWLDRFLANTLPEKPNLRAVN